MRDGVLRRFDIIVLVVFSLRGYGVGCRGRFECGYGGIGRDYLECIFYVRNL